MAAAGPIRAMTKRTILQIQDISDRQRGEFLVHYSYIHHPQIPGIVIGILIKDAIRVRRISTPFRASAATESKYAILAGRGEFIQWCFDLLVSFFHKGMGLRGDIRQILLGQYLVA